MIFKRVKQYFFGCIVVFLYSKALLGKNIVLRGEIYQPTSRKVTLLIRTNPIEKPIFLETTLDRKNKFVFSIPSSKAIQIDFTHGKVSTSEWWESAKFYGWVFEPGDSINIAFDTKNFWKTIKVSGNNLAKFNYYISDFIMSDINYQWRDSIEINHKMSLEKQFNYLDKVLKIKKETLIKYKGKLSPFFTLFQECEINAMVEASKGTIIQSLQHDSLFRFENLSQSLKSFILKQVIQNRTSYYSDEYLNYCENIATLKFGVAIEKKSTIANINDFHSFRADILGKDIDELLLAKEVLKLVEIKEIQPFMKLKYEVFKNKYPRSVYIKLIDKKCSEQTTMVNNYAPFFMLKDDNGQLTSSQSFRGKLIFIDFWASWCKPCIEEMKFTRSVKDSLNNRTDIVFLYISADKNIDKWLNAIKLYNIEGIHLIANDSVLKSYHIDSFPSYIMVGKDGKVLNTSPPRPSEQNGISLITVLKNALNR
jgi:thiol-disulfide isomerase/thioredoxin